MTTAARLRRWATRAVEPLPYLLVAAGLVLSLLRVWVVEQPKRTGQRVQVDLLWPTYTPQKVRMGEWIAETYMRQNPGVFVNLIQTHDPYGKLQVMIAGRTAPDVIWMGVGWQQFVDSLMPLDDLIATAPEVDRHNFSDKVWAGVQWRGRTYLLPSGAQTGVIYYNKDLFDEAGVPYPHDDWTWDEMVEAAKALTRDFDGDGVIDQYGLQLEGVYRTPFLQYGMPMADPEWRRSQIDHPVARAILRDYRDLVYKHRVMPSILASRELGLLPMFEAGRVGMHAASAYAIESFRKTPYDWDVVPFPRYRHDGRYYRSTGLWEEEFAILANTDVPEEAWKLAKWCAGREAVEWASREGHVVPARKDVAYSEAFLVPDQKPRNARAFLDSWEFATPEYMHPWWKRIAVEFEPLWQQFMEGSEGRRIDADELVDRLHETLQHILDEYQAEHE